jgi:IMP dehydrogenase
VPAVAKNMDSVTGTGMAKAMAFEGGIGVVHRGMPIAARVKRTHGHVLAPVSAARHDDSGGPEFTERHSITGILIEDTRGNGILVGLLSNRDLR